MSFSTNIFIFYFFPIVLLISIILNKISHRLLKLSLLFFSYTFCYWIGKTTFIYVILVSMFLYIYSLTNRKKLIMYVAIILIILFLFKFISYANLDNYYVNRIALLQPVALSFVSLSAISYCIELYKEQNIHKVSFIDTSLYISFFPKYISGPIILWNDFEEELIKLEITLDNVVEGIVYFIKGLFYKVVIADVLLYSINPIIGNYSKNNSILLLLTIFVYSFVIYFDFMGYSEMAIGISRVFGFNFKQNFDHPYTSHSLNEFYRRWHISLGNFLKKYVYIPLGGNRKNTYINIFIVMLLSGIWHGNDIAYLLWGIITGLLMMIERKYIKENRTIFIFINYLVVSILWLPFMLGSFKDVINYLSCIITNHNVVSLYSIEYYFNIRTIVIMIIAILLSFIKLNKLEEFIKKKPLIYYIIFVCIFIISLIFMINSTYTPFIYFRF